ncbi:hypothetical protein V496_09073 [Pseudogymnoascus sp. VKM F-4515 (FW-2607)]|nr:hypothetical protein V496_09073 [Pseudogymnoascus sp. VKM F-4515 (FW-2607)]KFY77786.1 hypothetical protein V498_09258 [Pseudogymnoascus sp. VKM F-4517 (FW-2822)]
MKSKPDDAARELESLKDDLNITMSNWHHGNAHRLGAYMEIFKEAQERTRKKLFDALVLFCILAVSPLSRRRPSFTTTIHSGSSYVANPLAAFWLCLV